MEARLAPLLTVLGAVTLFAGASQSGAPVTQTPSSRITLRAVGGLPAHVVGKFRDPIGFAVAKSGEYVVLDSRSHTVYLIDRSGDAIKRTLPIGIEPGKVLSPASLSLANDIFAIADAPAVVFGDGAHGADHSRIGPSRNAVKNPTK